MSVPSPGTAHPGRSLLVCGFGPFPGAPSNPAALVVEGLRRDGFSPAGAKAEFRVLPTTWTGAFATLTRAVRETAPAGVLIVGVDPAAREVRVETRALNRARPDLPDADGACLEADGVAPGGPQILAAACATEVMVQAVAAQGLPAVLSADAGDYLCNHTFYRALAELAPRGVAVGFLHLPQVSAAFSLDDLARAVRAGSAAMALSMESPVPATVSTG